MTAGSGLGSAERPGRRVSPIASSPKSNVSQLVATRFVSVQNESNSKIVVLVSAIGRASAKRRGPPNTNRSSAHRYPGEDCSADQTRLTDGASHGDLSSLRDRPPSFPPRDASGSLGQRDRLVLH